MPTRVMVVEDEYVIANDIKTTLKRMGYAVGATVASGEEAIVRASRERPDLVLMDIVLRGEADGIEAAREIGCRFNIPVVFLTSFADDGLFDLFRIESGKIELHPVDCSPQQVVDEVLSLMQILASQKHLSLHVNYLPSLPKAIRTDPVRLRQILINLLDNAIKFTESGGVKISVRSARPENGTARMQFEIVDTGIGMTAEEISRLFQPFTRADLSHGRRFSGTGMRLSISQKLARMLGGKIEVQSEPGKGSTFTLSVDPGPPQVVPPLKTTAPASATEQEPIGEKRDGKLSGRILLAEDVVDLGVLIRHYLQRAGLEVDLAEDGLIACEKALASIAEGKPYDLILMDIHMPKMDGHEATRRLRNDGWKGPIVALTVRVLSGDREECLEAGCDDYISKPVSRETLLSTIARHLRQATRPLPS